MDTPKPNVPMPDVSYQVMPSGNKGGNAPTPPTSGGGGSGRGSSWGYILITILVLLIIGGLGYYFLGIGPLKNFNWEFWKKTPTTTSTTTDQPVNSDSSSLDPNFLQQYFNTNTCTSDSTCGASADPDNDGLTNLEEQQKGTNPILADTDGDGLADGDEVKCLWH
jgi:hypothetical protein